MGSSVEVEKKLLFDPEVLEAAVRCAEAAQKSDAAGLGDVEKNLENKIAARYGVEVGSVQITWRGCIYVSGTRVELDDDAWETLIVDREEA